MPTRLLEGRTQGSLQNLLVAAVSQVERERHQIPGYQVLVYISSVDIILGIYLVLHTRIYSYRRYDQTVDSEFRELSDVPVSDDTGSKSESCLLEEGALESSESQLGLLAQVSRFF